MLLDFKRRLNIHVVHEGSIDDDLQRYLCEIQSKLEQGWSFHSCDVEGCSWCLVVDGGMKPIRRLCHAKKATVFKFENTDGVVQTGCTSLPIVGKKWCKHHEPGTTPSICAQDLNPETLRKLHKSRKQVKSENVRDTVFNIQGIRGKRTLQDNTVQYLIKWEGYEESENTWEPSSNIPKFIQRYYNETGNQDLPQPRVRKVKTAGDQEFYLLHWDGQGGEPIPEFFPKTDFEIEGEDLEGEESQCNTKKHHGRQFYR